jgi:hypothetical protein
VALYRRGRRGEVARRSARDPARLVRSTPCRAGASTGDPDLLAASVGLNPGNSLPGALAFNPAAGIAP